MHISRHSNHTTLCIPFFLHFLQLPATFPLGCVSRHVQPAFLAVVSLDPFYLLPVRLLRASVATSGASTSDLMFWEKFLVSDVLATNLMLTKNKVLLFFKLSILLGWKWVRFMLFMFLSSISHPRVCLLIIPNWRSSLHTVGNNTHVAHK